jgi:hypothetical protein
MFDGRYVYLVPWGQPLAARYDTTKPLGAPASWATFDLQTPFGGSVYRGGEFDGRYVYYVPEYNPTAGGTLEIVRCDTTAASFDASACTGFDLHSLDASATGYVGAVFDGEYLYLGPETATLALRFDVRHPRGPLTSSGGSFL